jgi:hypothetical protein
LITDAGRFHDLAGGDLVGEVRRQAMNLAHPFTYIQRLRRKTASMPAAIASMIPATHQKLGRLAAREVRQRHVHAPHAAQHGERQEDGGHHRQHLHHLD